MRNISVSTRDVYLLLMGVLLAFVIQVGYEILTEFIDNASGFYIRVLVGAIAALIFLILLQHISKIQDV